MKKYFCSCLFSPDRHLLNSNKYNFRVKFKWKSLTCTPTRKLKNKNYLFLKKKKKTSEDLKMLLNVREFLQSRSSMNAVQKQIYVFCLIGLNIFGQDQ